jgi:hypothetical protein
LHLSYRKSLQPSKENIQHFKNFITFSLCLWVIFVILSGSRDHMESGSTALRISKKYYLGDIPHGCGLHNVPDDELLDRLVLGASLQKKKKFL